jgi:hypothetical protein
LLDKPLILWYNSLIVNNKGNLKMAKSKSFLGSALANKRSELKALKAEVAQLAKQYAHERFAIKHDKAVKAEARKEAAIAKAKAKLEKLTAPVGAKALKANRKPSAVVTINPAV